MKLGLIIIFRNNENDIHQHLLLDKLDSKKTLEICFVDNHSTDNTLEILKDIKEECSSNIPIVEIKKKSSIEAAKRAGARFIFNQFDLKHICYLDYNSELKKETEIGYLVEMIEDYASELINFNKKVIEKQFFKRNYLKNIFSAITYLNKLI